MKSTFVSYSTSNKEIAYKVVEALEKSGLKCYIAPRDITPGKDYASEIVEAIKSKDIVTLIFTKESNLSGYVLREINSAILHNKIVIPYKLDDAEPSEAMEFYLGVSHWIVEKDFESGINLLINAINGTQDEESMGESSIRFSGPIMLDYSDVEKIGYTVKKIVMETIEIDYLTLRDNNYIINESIEGNVDSWLNHVKMYPDLYSLLIKDDCIIGYWQIILINEQNYNQIIKSNQMVDADMLEFYEFGGEFYCYIAIMPILPEYENSTNMMLLWDKLFQRIESLLDRDIIIKRVGISVYSPLLENMVKKLGFECVGNNSANGKIYDLDINSFGTHSYIKSKYPSLCKKLKGI